METGPLYNFKIIADIFTKFGSYTKRCKCFRVITFTNEFSFLEKVHTKQFINTVT